MISRRFTQREEQESLDAWFVEYTKIGDRLREAPECQTQWQWEIDQHFARLSIPKLLQYVDFHKLAAQMTKDIGTASELFLPVTINGIRGPITGPEPAKVLIAKLAHVRKGRAIAPHGHTNMVSAFLTISGRFHIRQYDRLQMTEQTMLLRETCNRVCGVGEWSSVSDDRTNVHWLTAVSDNCFLFTTKMIKIVDGRDCNGRINVDILNAKLFGNSLLEAPRIGWKEAAEKY